MTETAQDWQERASRLAVEAGRRGEWTMATCETWMAQAEQMTEEQMRAWERAADTTE